MPRSAELALFSLKPMSDEAVAADSSSAPSRPAGYVLKGGTLARAHPPMVARADLRVLRGQIAEVGESLSPLGGEEVIDCRGLLIMPGFAAAHAHLGHSLARGHLDDVVLRGAGACGLAGDPSCCGDDLWREVSAAHDEASLYHSALAGALEALSRGVTTIADLVGAPAAMSNALEIVARALGEVGLRGILSRSAPEVGAEAANRCLDETAAFLEKRREPMLSGLVGAFSPSAAAEDTLRRAADLADARGVGVHLHVGETIEDSEAAAERYGLGLGEHLMESGVLSPRSLLVVGAHLSFEELAMARESGSWFAWCPRASMALCREQPAAQHLPPDRTVLGTDVMSVHPLAELEAAYLKMRDAGSLLPPSRAILMLVNGQRLASRCLGVSLGTLEPGAAADLVFFEFEPFVELTERTLAEHLIYGLRGARVEAVMADGRFLLRGGVPLLEGLADIRERIRREAKALRGRLRGVSSAVKAVSAGKL
jgi:cytosine/adenosine deaminase-related metal-dependent hydrolase